MDTETLNEINDCILLVQRLKARLRQDAEEVERAIHGHLLEVYRAAIAEVVQRLQQIEEQLVAMRDSLMAAPYNNL